MGVTPDDRDLLGAYALDALDPDEVVMVEALLERDPDAAREVQRLRGAASWIAATEALAPPRDLRTHLFERATVVPPELRAYRRAVARHESLLDSISEDDLGTGTTNGLSVGDLIVHLAAMESAVAETIGLPSTVSDATEVVARTEAYVAAYGNDPLGAGRHTWRDATAALEAWALQDDGRARLPWNGFDVGRRTALASRAFELWTHDDDVRVALGRAPEVPTESELSLMSDIAVGILPACVAVTSGSHAAAARIVLTGPGGGDWTLSFDGRRHDDVVVTVTMDAVTYCRLVAERVTPDDCGAIVDGDLELGRRILESASALATL